MPSLSERIMNIIRDIRWIISVASRPDEHEFNTTAKFVLLLVFMAGVFQIVFHVAGVQIASATAHQPLPTLGGVRDAVAVISSLVAMLVVMLYLMAKLR